MSLKDLLSLAPVPCLDVAVTLVTSTYENAKNVTVYKQQCRDMSQRCISLLLALREGLHDQPSPDWAYELENVLYAIDKKVKDWAAMGKLKSFLQQSEIREALDGFQRSIDGAMMKYHISSGLELRRDLYASRASQERDRAEIREVLQSIVQSNTEMKTLLEMTTDRPVVEEVMGRLQMELQDPDISAPQEESFREGLWYLHQETSKLPPLTDLTGQVEREGAHAAFFGTSNDVYRGWWLGREKVALRLPRNLPNRPKTQQRFEREVSVWRQLVHPSIVPLYGVAKIGEHMYSVSPWMDNGTAIDYVQEYPECDRLKMISEIVAGLEYLHSQEIFHGDLRAANILISDEGVARLSDFGLSKFLGDCGQGTTAPNVNPRWFAPEIVKGTGSFSKQSDIWSLGMAFLEILTGKQPFAEVPIDITVLNYINAGKTPKRPKGKEHGLGDEMWSLIESCWKKKPESRPNIQVIKAKIAELRTKGTDPLKTSPPTLSFSDPLTGAFARPFLITTPVDNRGKRTSGVQPPTAGNNNNNNNTGRRPSTAGSSTSSNSGKTPFGGFKSLANNPEYFIPEAKSPVSPQSSPPFSPHISGPSSGSSIRSFGSMEIQRTQSRPLPSPPTNGSNDLKLEYPGPPRIDIPHLSPSKSSGRTISSSFESESGFSKYYPQPPFGGTSPPIARRDTRASENSLLSPLSPNGNGNGKEVVSPSQSSQSVGSPLERQRSPSYSFNTPARQLSRPAVGLSVSPPQLASPLPPVQTNNRIPSTDSYQINPAKRAPSLGIYSANPARSVLSTTGSVHSRLEEAITTSDISVYTTQQGAVRAGTFEGFVERFISNFNLRKDDSFRDVFLTGCIDLVTPEGFFSVLARRFEDTSGDPREHTGIQTIIFMLMIFWLESRRMPVTMDVLLQMRTFCQESLRFKTSSSMIRRGNDLLQLIDQRIAEQADNDQVYSFSVGFPCSYSLKHPIGRPQTPKDLAVALTILEGEKYKAIMPCDYLAYLRPEQIHGYHNPVEIARVVNNHIIQWVKQSILHYDEVLPRADVIKFYVHTAQECRNMRNFSSLIAIAIALNSAPVERLKLTKKQLPAKMANCLEEIVAISNPSNNHAAYRSVLCEVGAVEYKQCVPWLALHLKQIHAVLDDPDHGQVMIVDGRPLVNFKRYSEYAKVFREHLSFEAPDLERQRVAGHLAYLEQRLADVRVDEASEQELMSRSLRHEQGESKMIRNHTLELAALGFSRPKNRRPTTAGGRSQAS